MIGDEDLTGTLSLHGLKSWEKSLAWVAQRHHKEKETMIRFFCPACKSVLQAPPVQAGEKVVCPKCGQRMLIPNPVKPAASNKTVLGSLLPESKSPVAGNFTVSDSGMPPMRNPNAIRQEATIQTAVPGNKQHLPWLSRRKLVAVAVLAAFDLILLTCLMGIMDKRRRPYEPLYEREELKTRLRYSSTFEVRDLLGVPDYVLSNAGGSRGWDWWYYIPGRTRDPQTGAADPHLIIIFMSGRVLGMRCEPEETNKFIDSHGYPR
ncbi:MAG: TFIIB-type zinc ribbon-containing protein [Gemmataceae bacterium]